MNSKLTSSTEMESEKMISEGLSYAKLGKHKEAISFFDKVLKSHPDNIEALYQKGVVLINLDKN